MRGGGKLDPGCVGSISGVEVGLLRTKDLSIGGGAGHLGLRLGRPVVDFGAIGRVPGTPVPGIGLADCVSDLFVMNAGRFVSVPGISRANLSIQCCVRGFSNLSVQAWYRASKI